MGALADQRSALRRRVVLTMSDIQRITPGSKADIARRMADRRRELIARPLAEIWEELAAVAMDGSDHAPQAGDPVEKWAKSEAESIYPDPFASVYSEEESQENSTAASQREAFIEGANWARGVLTPSAAIAAEPQRAPASCPHCIDATDCASVDVCCAVEAVYAAPTTSPEPDAVREALEKRKAEIKTATQDHGWTNVDTAWHRAFGELSGLNYALEELRLAALSRPAHGMSKVIEAVRGYHLALDRREHGDIACHKALNEIMTILDMSWKQGVELARNDRGSEAQ